MGKTVLFLSPHFPPHFVNFIVGLKKAGCKVVTIGDSPYYSLSQTLKESVAEYYEVSSMEDYDKVYRAVGHLVHNHGRIDWVQSHNEHWLVLEAKIREDFNIKGGYLPDEIMTFRRKSYMKEVFKKLGLKVAKGKVLNSYEEVLSFVHGTGAEAGVNYPVIVKPDTGVGAVGTFKLTSDEQVKSFFEGYGKDHPQDFIFEEFIEGKLFTLDGITDVNGDVLLYGSFEYDKGVMDTVLSQSQIYYYIKRTVDQDALEAGKKLVKEFKVRGHFFHFEFFRTPTGELVPLEVNLRLPGGNTIDMYNYSYDYDFYQLWADIVAQNTDKIQEWKSRFKESPNAKYFTCYAARRNNIKYPISHDQLLSRCKQGSPEGSEVQMVMNMEMPALFRQAMGDYAYVFRTPNEDALIDMIKATHQISVS
eukprot:TRINITY_DN766_c0_g1_i1.p1 TRINITY_DN766_c0_g1~~TRINITY_DN766_c0_g1_i1.p1  ORF type:complete len:418 (+),score=70.81 TRINITY_DN766_c0_g1_i1:408-1661(+)